MAAVTSDHCVDALTRLARRLPGLGLTEALTETTAALASLDLVVGVATVQSDVAVVAALDASHAATSRLSPELGRRMPGLRIPIGTVDFLRTAVHLRQPHRGIAGGGEALRRFADDAALAAALPVPGDGLAEMSVPIVVDSRVSGVLWAWGPRGAEVALGTLEAAAAMLTGVWRGTDSSPPRFAPPRSGRACQAERRTIETMLADRLIRAGVQPIARLYDSHVIAYEALARFTPREPILTPDHLFSAAADLAMQARVDLACLRAALREAPRFNGADLFANVLIGTLLDPAGMTALDDAVREAAVDPASVVLEFSEREPVPDLARLQAIAAELRVRGFRIAVDDAGSGHASMRLIAELRPDFIKVDRSLITTVDTDNARRALVVALLSFSGHIGARLIAEGIETDAERETLLRLGVMYGQGYLLGRPVLTSPLDGHPPGAVVDETWFARQTVMSTRAPMLPSEATPNRATTAADFETPKPRNKRGLARALSDTARALQAERDPVRIVEVMAEMMRRVISVSEMVVLAADYETHSFVPMIATGPDRENLLATSYGMELRGHRPGVRARPPGERTRPVRASTRQAGSQHPAVVQQSALLIPLVAGEHKLGILTCWRLGVDMFTPGDLDAASLFAHIAAATWRRAQLDSELVDAALTDPAHTPTRTAADSAESGGRELEKAARDGIPVALILLDLDRFADVNDMGGHAAGDLALQRVAARLRATVRTSDLIVRLGGDEFAVLVAGCSASAGLERAVGLLRAVREVTVVGASGAQKLTASDRRRSYPADAGDLDGLLASADRAMRAAKARGGNGAMEARWSVAPSSPSTDAAGVVWWPTPADTRCGAG